MIDNVHYYFNWSYIDVDDNKFVKIMFLKLILIKGLKTYIFSENCMKMDRMRMIYFQDMIFFLRRFEIQTAKTASMFEFEFGVCIIRG